MSTSTVVVGAAIALLLLRVIGRSFFAKPAGMTLAEADAKIEDTAKNTIVKGIERLIDASHGAGREAPSSRDAFPPRDYADVDAIWAELQRRGFNAPSTFDPAPRQHRPPEKRTISEFALSSDGTIVANVFTLRVESKPRACLVLTSAGAQRRAVTLSADTNTLPSDPAAVVTRLAFGTPAATMLANHQALSASLNESLHSFGSIDEFLDWRQVQTEKTRKYRISLGLEIFEPYLRAQFTGERAVEATVYLQKIRAHPEWYKYSSGAEAPVDAAPE